MKEIKLTQGKVALVDDGDYEWLSQWKWYAVEYKHTWYAFRSVWSNGSNRRLPMHRAILNTPIGMETDHADHNGLNNQRENIRICTKSENQWNKKGHGESCFIGVCRYTCTAKRYSKKENKIKTYVYEPKWVARIVINGRAVSLGYYKKEEDAALAYDKAAIKYHGEFASLNFPI